MAMNKKIIAVLAIFLLIASVSAISAEENETGQTGSDPVVDEELKDTEDDNATDDGDVEDVEDNPYRHGELTPNEKAFQEDAKAAGENSKPVSAYGSPTTGNPILALLAAIAILGAYPLSRKK